MVHLSQNLCTNMGITLLLVRSGIIRAAVMCDVDRWPHKRLPRLALHSVPLQSKHDVAASLEWLESSSSLPDEGAVYSNQHTMEASVGHWLGAGHMDAETFSGVGRIGGKARP